MKCAIVDLFSTIFFFLHNFCFNNSFQVICVVQYLFLLPAINNEFKNYFLVLSYPLESEDFHIIVLLSEN